MPKKAKATSKPKSDACKFCKAVFDHDANPLVSKPEVHDTVKRRCAGATDCKACYSFLRTDEFYGSMTAGALVEHLENPNNQSKYDDKFGDWCTTRRDGGRRTRNRGGSLGVCQGYAYWTKYENMFLNIFIDTTISFLS